MTSKWVRDLTVAIFRGKSDNDESPDTIINKIDKLLRRVAFSTDNEDLHNEIMKEIKEDDGTNPT